MRLTAQEVYDKLVNEDGILQLEGQIKFYLGDVNIIVKQRDNCGKYHAGMVCKGGWIREE